MQAHHAAVLQLQMLPLIGLTGKHITYTWCQHNTGAVQ